MFIYHFNRLIRNRYVWLAFAIIVAAAFLTVDSCTLGRGANPATDAGRFGKTRITNAEYTEANTFVHTMMRPSDISPAAVSTQVWEHIAVMHRAQDLGLSATPAEIRDQIVQDPGFAENGGFSFARYQVILANAFRMTPAQYERLMGNAITRTKAMQLATSAAFVSPMEIEDEATALTDTITVSYAVITNSFTEADVTVTEEDIAAFYAENRESFAEQDLVSVAFATIDATNFLAQAMEKIDEEDLIDYYEGNEAQFTRTIGTNTVASLLPMDSVREELTNSVALAEASTLASYAISDFSDSIVGATVEEFLAKCAAAGYATNSTPLFAGDGFVKGIPYDVLPDFRNAAFELDSSREDARYAVIDGKGKSYLLFAITNVPARIPELAEIHDRVKPSVVAKAVADKFSALANSTRENVAASLAAEKSFNEACADAGISVATNGLSFSVQNAAASSFLYANNIVPAAMREPAGKLCEPRNVFNGALLIYVESRTAGEKDTVALAKEQVRAALAERADTFLGIQWLDWNLADMEFESFRAESFDYSDDE